MAERIVNITCPNCKHGIKHDTLMNTTTSVPPEDYPVLNSEGRAWCKACQRGTLPNEDGLCIVCIGKGRMTRLRPIGEKLVAPEPEVVKRDDEKITINMPKTEKTNTVKTEDVKKIYTDMQEKSTKPTNKKVLR